MNRGISTMYQGVGADIKGSLSMGNIELQAGEGVAVSGGEKISLKSDSDTEILLFDLT